MKMITVDLFVQKMMRTICFVLRKAMARSPVPDSKLLKILGLSMVFLLQLPYYLFLWCNMKGVGEWIIMFGFDFCMKHFCCFKFKKIYNECNVQN